MTMMAWLTNGYVMST